MATTRFQPAPTYAMPVIEDKRANSLVFNPIWLKWFLDLSQNLGVDGAGSGNVSAVSVATAGGLTGTSSGGDTPTLTLGTTVTGLVKGNGASFSAAAAGTDYLAPAAIGVTVQAYDADLTTWAGITPGANIGTALAIAVGTDGAPVIKGGALGTPSSGTVTNLTGTASININGTVGATTQNTVNSTTTTVTDAGSTSYEGYTFKTNYADGVNKSFIWRDASDVTGRITSRYVAATGYTYLIFGSLYNSGYTSTDLLSLSPVALAMTGAISATTTLRPGGYTVGTLPAGTIGMKCYVTDALAPAYLVLLAAGGAAYSGAQYSGTQWVGD